MRLPLTVMVPDTAVPAAGFEGKLAPKLHATVTVAPAATVVGKPALVTEGVATAVVAAVLAAADPMLQAVIEPAAVPELETLKTQLLAPM
jgi:hypothetical protein